MAAHGDDLPFDLDDERTVQSVVARPATPRTEWDDEEVTNVGALGARARPGSTLDAADVRPSPGLHNAYLMQLLQDGEDLAHILAPDEVLVRIGRGRENEIQVASDGEISRRHCVLMRQGDEFFLEDLGSTNGSLINGEPVALARLGDGDEVRLGESIFRFVCVAPTVAARGRTLLAG